jgi:hypothetical protein
MSHENPRIGVWFFRLVFSHVMAVCVRSNEVEVSHQEGAELGHMTIRVGD